MSNKAIAIAFSAGYRYGHSNLSRKEGRFEDVVEYLNSRTGITDDERSLILRKLASYDRQMP